MLQQGFGGAKVGYSKVAAGDATVITHILPTYYPKVRTVIAPSNSPAFQRRTARLGPVTSYPPHPITTRPTSGPEIDAKRLIKRCLCRIFAVQKAAKAFSGR